MERGELRTDRYMIAEIAAALECAVADLTGKPRMPGDRALETAHSKVQPLWRSLVEIAPDEPTDRDAEPLAALAIRLDIVTARRRAADFAAVGGLLPDLLRDLHAAEAGRERREASMMLVSATHSATFTLRELGYVAEAALAGERCRQAAERHGGPGPLAVADWLRAHVAAASGSFRRSLTLATRAADELGRHLGTPAALELLGMHYLLAAIASMSSKHHDDAMSYVDKAWELAQRTGETDSWTMAFGPSNVGVWKMDLLTHIGEPGKAVEVSRSINTAVLPSASRRMAYYVALARALADLHRDSDAVRMLLVAERTAPQLARSSTDTREISRSLLNRSRREAGGSDLRGLCERMGVTA